MAENNISAFMLENAFRICVPEHTIFFNSDGTEMVPLATLLEDPATSPYESCVFKNGFVLDHNIACREPAPYALQLFTFFLWDDILVCASAVLSFYYGQPTITMIGVKSGVLDEDGVTLAARRRLTAELSDVRQDYHETLVHDPVVEQHMSYVLPSFPGDRGFLLQANCVWALLANSMHNALKLSISLHPSEASDMHAALLYAIDYGV